MAQVVNGGSRQDGRAVRGLYHRDEINNLFAVRKWLPTFRAMGPMLRELYKHPEKGFLGGEFLLRPGTSARPVLALLRGP